MPMYLSDAGADSSVYTIHELIIILSLWILWLLSARHTECFLPDPDADAALKPMSVPISPYILYINL